MDDGVNLLGFMQQYVLPFNNQEPPTFQSLSGNENNDNEQIAVGFAQQSRSPHYSLRTRSSHRQNIYNETEAFQRKRDKDLLLSTPETRSIDRKLPKLQKKIKRFANKSRLNKFWKSRHSKLSKGKKSKQKKKKIHSETSSSTQGNNDKVSGDMPSQFSFESLKEELSENNGADCGSLSVKSESNCVIQEDDNLLCENRVISPSLLNESNCAMSSNDTSWCLPQDDAVHDGINLLDHMYLPNGFMKHEPGVNSTNENSNVENGKDTQVATCATLMVKEERESSDVSNDLQFVNPLSYSENGNMELEDFQGKLKSANEQNAMLQFELSRKNSQLEMFAKRFSDLASGFLELSKSFQEFVNESNQD